LEGFPPRWPAALPSGSKDAKDLSLDGRMGVNAGVGDVA